MKNAVTFLLFLTLLIPYSAQAESSLTVTEIMYDAKGTDTGHEWLEIYNAGSESIPLSELTLFEENSNHTLTATAGGEGIPAGKYAVITSNPTTFLLDFPVFSGIVIKASFSLNNEGETFSIKRKGVVLQEVSYTNTNGAAGNGNTLHASSATWAEGAPTPGEEGSALPEPVSTGEESVPATTEEASTSSAPTTKATTVKSFTSRINGTKTGFVNVPSFFTSEIKVGSEKRLQGKFLWSFGDGVEMELSENKRVEHSYLLPGTYVVVLEYYSTSNQSDPDTSARLVVDIGEVSVRSAVVAVHNTSYLEIENNGATEVNLTGWIITLGKEYKKIARNTIVLPGKKIILVSYSLPKDIIPKLLLPNGIAIE